MKKFIFLTLMVFTLINTYGQFSFDTCLVAYYPFNGNANDESINENTGIVNGPTLTFDRFGLIESAYSFDGINDYILISDDSTLNPQNITICVWYKTVSFEGFGNNPIIDKAFITHEEPYYQYHIGVVGDQYTHQGQARFQTDLSVDSIRVKYFTPDNFWTPDNWYFLSITFDGSTYNTYINGELYNSIYASGEITSYGQNLFIGKFGNIDQYTPGVIDDIRIYSRALYSNEIIELYEENPLNVILNNNNTDLIVYPNPTKNNVNIKSNLLIKRIKLLNLAGKTLMDISDNTKTIDLTNIPKGLYVILFYDDELSLISSKKLIIQ